MVSEKQAFAKYAARTDKAMATYDKIETAATKAYDMKRNNAGAAYRKIQMKALREYVNSLKA